jgi:hypothetical protein
MRPALALAALALAVPLAFSAPADTALAQEGAPPVPMTPPEDTPSSREILHLGALGAYSAGFVLEAYGYIGLLADVMHYGVYEPETVKSMLGETRVFLQKALDKLAVYRNGTVTVQPEDLEFINGIAEILGHLLDESDGLMAYCDGFQRADFEKFRDSRAKAWALIKTHLRVK